MDDDLRFDRAAAVDLGAITRFDTDSASTDKSTGGQLKAIVSAGAMRLPRSRSHLLVTIIEVVSSINCGMK